LNGQLLFIILALFSFESTQRGITSPQLIFSCNDYTILTDVFFSLAVLMMVSQLSPSILRTILHCMSIHMSTFSQMGMTYTAWDFKMVHYNQRMERTWCLWEILFFQISWLSMTWKIRSSGGLTTTVHRALKLRMIRQAQHIPSVHTISPPDGDSTGTSPWFCCW